MDKPLDWLKPGWPLLVILIVFSYAVYSHTLHFPFFIFDDGAYILANDEVRNLTFDSFLHFWINSKIPIPYNIWQITFAIFGENPGAFRFLNILSHGLTSYMVFKILYSLSSEENRNKFAPILLFATLLFLIHPMNVESVVWISSLNGILSLLFGLLAYEQYMKIEKVTDKESTIPIILSILFFTLSLLSKPVAAVFPMIFIITDFFILNRNIKEKWWLFLYYFSLTIALSLLHVQGMETDLFKYIKWYERLFIAGNAFLFYLGKIFLPFQLFVIYPDSILDILKSITTNAKVTIPVFNFSIICFLIAFWTKKEYRKIATGITFFFIFLIPISGIIPFEFQKLSYVADRYAYHSIFALSFTILFLGYELVKKYPRIVKVITYGSTAFMVLLAFKNFSYSAKWVQNSKIVKESYENALQNTYLGLSYANTKINEYRLDEAMSILNGVYTRDPRFNETLSSIVETFTFRCDPQRTLQILGLFEKSDASLPLETLLAKALLHISVGEIENAFTILVYIESSHLKLSDMAASLLEGVKKSLDQVETDSYMNLGYLNYKKYNYKKALEYFEKGKKVSSDDNIIQEFQKWIQNTKGRIDAN